MSTIAALAPVLPGWVYPQAEITAELAPLLTGEDRARVVLERIQAGSGIETRHLAMPLGAYRDLRSFTQANHLFIRLGTDLAERAARQALETAGLAPHDVDFLLFTSVTGVSAPSLDALLVPRLGLRPDVKRLPSFGLGCAGGAAGLARVHDYLRGHPDHVALLVSVELCSLTLQRDDSSLANVVASGLFGDGASAVVMLGERRAAAWRSDRGASASSAAPEVIDTRSRIYPGTGADLGWDVGTSGFRIVLSPRVPEVIEANLGDDVAGFLYAHGLKAGDIGSWVVHAGGPKILDAVARSLDLADGALAASWRSLARAGNLSSSSVLHVLADTMAGRAGTTASGTDEVTTAADDIGAEGVLMAFGPGVSAELVLLRWPTAPVAAGAAAE